MSDHEGDEPPRKRPRQDVEAPPAAAASTYHDVALQDYTHLLLRVHILPNAWHCYKMYKKEGLVLKQSSFLFPRMAFALGDASIKHELAEWNGPDAAKNYDKLSIGMVLMYSQFIQSAF